MQEKHVFYPPQEEKNLPIAVIFSPLQVFEVKKTIFLTKKNYFFHAKKLFFSARKPRVANFSHLLAATKRRSDGKHPEKYPTKPVCKRLQADFFVLIYHKNKHLRRKKTILSENISYISINKEETL